MEHYQIYVPVALKQELLHLHHRGKVGGHFGYQKVLHWLKDRYYWPKMHNNVYLHCKSCLVCAARSAHGLRAEPKLLSEFPPSAPWVCINMDILKIGRMTEKGNLYILSMIDKLTRFCVLQAMPNQEAETVLKKFTESMLTLGFPHHIFTDRGTQFTSRLAGDLAKTFGMVCIYTSKFNPRSDGQAENLSRLF